jgi:glutathione S-transferase
MSTIRLTAFNWVPPFAEGLVRDLRVRWALEEAGLKYEERLITQEDKVTPRYRQDQPFGQVPMYEEDGLTMFETGAIVLHIAEGSEALMPRDREGRALTQTWLFAALNSIEPHIQNLALIDLFFPNEEWAKLRRPGVVQMVETRLKDLSARLDGRDHLVANRFTAADLMMVTVLRILRHTDLVERNALLHAYQQRCEARPAFKKALADQLAPFAKNAPPPGT